MIKIFLDFFVNDKYENYLRLINKSDYAYVSYAINPPSPLRKQK